MQEASNARGLECKAGSRKPVCSEGMHQTPEACLTCRQPIEISLAGRHFIESSIGNLSLDGGLYKESGSQRDLYDSPATQSDLRCYQTASAQQCQTASHLLGLKTKLMQSL